MARMVGVRDRLVGIQLMRTKQDKEHPREDAKKLKMHQPRTGVACGFAFGSAKAYISAMLQQI